MQNNREPIPIRRILEKLDRYFNGGEMEEAKALLEYWLKEAEGNKDIRGKMAILNEQMGLYRKLNEKEKGLDAVAKALETVKLFDEENLIVGTTYLNAATVYKAFGEAEKALPLYRSAQRVYLKELSPEDERLAGLDNNMALTLVELKQFTEAEALYREAISILQKKEHPENEIAITYLNLADLVCARDGIEEGENQIGAYIAQAEKLLDADSLPRDGYHAFVCEKCASVFGYYGYFLAEQKFKTRAREIRERT